MLQAKETPLGLFIFVEMCSSLGPWRIRGSLLCRDHIERGMWAKVFELLGNTCPWPWSLGHTLHCKFTLQMSSLGE